MLRQKSRTALVFILKPFDIMKKEKPKAIKTNKYLFHVSHPDFRNYIHREGLLPLVRPFKTVIPVGVYAHNVKTLPSYEWYPFVWPFEEDYELTRRYNNYDSLGMYDYWRIDTSLIDNEWHVKEFEKKNFNLSNLEKAIEEALNYSFKLSDMWVSGDLEQKRKLQRMIFTEGIEYNHENDIYRTFRTNAIFDVINSLSGIRKHKKNRKISRKFEKFRFSTRSGT